MAQREPDHYSAYIAIGLVVDIEEADKRQFAFISREATERNDTEALKLIQKFGQFPPWTDRENFIAFQKIVTKYDGVLRQISFENDFSKAAAATEEYNEGDFEKLDKGEVRTFNLVAKEIMAYKAEKRLGTWHLPVYFVQGKYDMATPTSLVEEYLAKAKSTVPMEYHLFDESSHFPAWENRTKFHRLLLRIKKRRSKI